MTIHSAPQIDESLVRSLVSDQFPHWKHLPVRPVARSGWDNRSFRLGDDLIARLPSAGDYEAQVLREQRWLPYLRSHLSLAVPEPVALGQSGRGYPWAWSIYKWIPGECAADQAPTDVTQFVEQLSRFLTALHAVPADEGPAPGAHNFYRGDSLKVYDEQFREAMVILGAQINTAAALQVWQSAVTSGWTQPPVWVHGDIALGNLILSEGRLAAVIDFGQVSVGDPACDLAIAWTYLRGEHRQDFRARLALDASTWCRGRGWALWKAAIIAAKLTATNAIEGQTCWQTIEEVLSDGTRTIDVEDASAYRP
jgi:aminoglycoside phosphotransferase (APT) family kinase protein